MNTVWRVRSTLPRYRRLVPAPESIICIDCGGHCGRITYEPDEGFEPGDIVAYRCRDCLDRWDVELTADDIEAEPPS